ncbi:MAG: 16S rRNA (cytosine(1402)-N(4))-methyltransferase RsmH [Acidobacteria bacterium]|nr:16S rRNA (cytosine(1402)-N(4))-methyltransferase RsmH [Acidobacteriota bacterium]
MSSEKVENLHASVLLNECLEMLAPQAGGIFVDATLGLAGHAEAILSAAPDVRLIGLDRDTEAIALAQRRLAGFGERARIVHANFAALKEVLEAAGVRTVNGVLADLGVSSLQFDRPERGFSFRFDAPLDMRMNAGSGEETAAELLERLSEEEIADLIYNYGEERFSRRIARRIVWKREIGEPVRTTRELAETVEKAIGRGRSKDKIHPATRTFQALRIAVNGEIEILEGFIRDAVEILKTDGKLAVITFHSLEDRIVKQTFRKLTGECSCPPRLPRCVCGAEKKVEILTRKPIAPGEIEIENNPRARSAKLRVCRKV